MQKLWVVILLALSACACDRMQEKAPKAVDPAAVAAYHAADRALLERARQGVRSTFTVIEQDGSSKAGFNDIINGPPFRMREVRTDYEAVGVGDIICKTATGGSEPVCEEGEFMPGLAEVDDATILRAKSSVARCGRATCRLIRIEQASVPWDETGKGAKREKASAQEPRLVVVLLVGEDGLPYSETEWQLSGRQRVEGQATYTFDYATPVPPIELPPEASAIVTREGG